jgi:hypothetical protein
LNLKPALRTISLLALLLGFCPAMAQEIIQLKGTKALINLSGSEASAGTEFFALDSGGKKRAILRVRQVKGDRAIADVIKGSAKTGQSLQPRGGAAAAPAEARVQDVASEDDGRASGEDRVARPRGFLGQFLKRGTAVGVLGGFAQNSMSLTGKGGGFTEDLTLTGNSFNVMGFYDYDLSKSFTIRSKAGIETFDVKASANNAAICSNSTTCDVSFTYLSGEISAHFNFMTGKTRAWAGAGLAFLLAVAKKSTVTNLDASNATNNMILLGAGADISVGSGRFIPVSFEYGMFPASTVKATSILLRAGYGWRF